MPSANFTKSVSFNIHSRGLDRLCATIGCVNRNIFLPSLFMRRPRKDKLAEFSVLDVDSPFARPIVIPIEDSLDLHPFAPQDIPSVVEEYIEQCSQAGIYEIRLIHGRGKGIQRRIIRSLLEKHPQVLFFKDALPELGGWGATVAVLKHGPSGQPSD
jgi:Smr domain